MTAKQLTHFLPKTAPTPVATTDYLILPNRQLGEPLQSLLKQVFAARFDVSETY